MKDYLYLNTALTNELNKEIKEDVIERIKNKIERYDFSKKLGDPFINSVFGKFSNIKSFIHGTVAMLRSYYEDFMGSGNIEKVLPIEVLNN